MHRFPRHPAVWFSALACWFGLLWFLSSHSGGPQKLPPLPHFDKLAHFSYFLAGGFLLAGGSFWRNPQPGSWKRILGGTILVIAAVGGIDEWHQCYTPGRNGADPWDWLADVLGGTAGAFLFKVIQRRLP